MLGFYVRRVEGELCGCSGRLRVRARLACGVRVPCSCIRNKKTNAPAAARAMLVLSRHRDEWMRSIERDCSLLHCSNPRCVHLFEHKSRGENGVDFKDRKCEETVLVNVLGRMEKRYRFSMRPRTLTRTVSSHLRSLKSTPFSPRLLCSKRCTHLGLLQCSRLQSRSMERIHSSRWRLRTSIARAAAGALVFLLRIHEQGTRTPQARRARTRRRPEHPHSSPSTRRT